MRIAIGVLMQETHSFSPLPTGLAEFRESPVIPLSEGENLVDAHRGIDSGLGGNIPRHGGTSRRLSIGEAIARAAEATAGPVVLQETGDLVGGGGAGDDVTLLSGLIGAGVGGLGAVIYDPDSVESGRRAARFLMPWTSTSARNG